MLFATPDIDPIDVLDSIREARGAAAGAAEFSAAKTAILQRAYYVAEQQQQSSRATLPHLARPEGSVRSCARCRLPGHTDEKCRQTLPPMPGSSTKRGSTIVPERMSPQDKPTNLTRTEATLVLGRRWAAMPPSERHDWARCKAAQEHHGPSAVSTFLAGDTALFPQARPRLQDGSLYAPPPA